MKNSSILSPSYDHEISALFYLLFLMLITALVLSVLFYPEPFLFWQHAFSNLGDPVSLHGYNNLLSQKIYTTGMIAESLVIFQISAHYQPPAAFRNQTVKRWLAVLGGFGFLISALSNSRFHVVHSIGVAMAVASLYFFTMFFLIELRKTVPNWRFFADMAIVQVVVFSYAVSFFMDSIYKQSLQKFCIIGLFYVLLQSASIIEDSFTPREIFDRRVRP